MKIDEQKRVVKRLGQGIVGKVAERKEPLLVSDISKDKRFQNYKSRPSYQSPSFICSPLMIKDKLIGVINIADKRSRKPFTQEELQLLDFLSNQIALNYQRTLLTQHLEHQLGKSSQETHNLKKQVKMQERLASLGKLAGGIAHEFNNPLDGVMRYTNLCLDHTHEDEVLREYLMEIKQGLKRMANIVKNLLACARNSPPTMQKVDLNHTIDQVLQDLDPYLVQKNIKLAKHFAHDLPQITDLGIERIVSNLVKNAIDAIEQEGTIEVSTALEKHMIKIQISDSGQGIPKEDLDKIFEPFYTTKDIDKGCGLGLTIVSEIVRYYNGKIDVRSKMNHETVFTVLLPI